MPATPIRRRATRALVLAAASLLVLGGCSHTQRAPSSYSGVKDNFIEGCQDIGKSDKGKADDSGQTDTTKIASPVNYCTCVWAAISNEKTGVPYSEFKKIQSDMQDVGGALPASYLKVIDKSNCDATSPSGKKPKSAS